MTPLVQHAPAFSAGDAAQIAAAYYGLHADAEALPSERDQNFLLRDPSGRRFVLKIANSQEALEVLDMQNRALEFLAGADTGLEWPKVVPTLSGNRVVPVEGAGGGAFFVRLLTWVEGVCFASLQTHSLSLLASLGKALASMDLALAGFTHPAARRVLHWDLRQAALARPYLELVSAPQRELVEPLLQAGESVNWSALPASIIHADANDYNVLVDAAGTRVVSLLDFGDMVWSATVCNLAVALAYVMLDRQDPIAAAAAVVEAYHQVRPLAPAELAALYTLASTRLAMSVLYAAGQQRLAPGNEYLNISNRPAWDLIGRLASLPAGWADDVFHRACGSGGGTPAEILALRRRHIGPSLSISYDQPLHIIRGLGSWLYDAGGRAYLDCVNNVAHVGHCHPAVVTAVGRQMALLNTNTRYLHENLVIYARELTATLPEPLSVVYFVSSGSEANELALRLARAHTGRRDVIVVETAYHGNTNALIEISPYKFDGPGGAGLPPGVAVVPMPNPYRGPHRGPDAGARYAAHVAFAAGKAPSLAAFFCESALSCAGQVILPEGYLSEAYRAVRAAGGVCVADEVQTGFGRPGTHFWMFQTQDVIPDIVTMGKPIGNGHPLGAVVTTPAIARSFDNGMEYFNTYGGNPVSCAAGLAVLQVMRDEHLQENVRDAGGHLTAGLRTLAATFPGIGDVRGLGLFLGFEMVLDPESRAPDAAAASKIVNHMKELGVLLSTDGPHHNVIKIKPPMVFSRTDADLVLNRLESVLRCL